MPLETATYIDQLVSSNPVHTDDPNQGDAHLRLIKSAIQATFPNFTAAALNSTQAQIDAAVAASTSNALTFKTGSASGPFLNVLGDLTTGIYQSAAGHLNVTAAGTEILDVSSAGLNITSGTLQIGGTAVFPLVSADFGAGSVVTAALAASCVTYAKMQNISNGALLGNFTGAAAAPSEYTLGAGLKVTGTTIIGTATIASVSPDLLIVNDGTNPNTKVNITCSEAVMSNYAGQSAYASNVSVSIDTTTTGANAMGTGSGSRAANQKYFWWLISNGSTTAALGSKQSTYAGLVSAGDLPSGYTFAKRVGANFTDASSNLYRVKQTGQDAHYILTASTNTASPPIVAAMGTSGNNVSCSVAGVIPATATDGLFTLELGHTAAVAVYSCLSPNANYGTAASATDPPFAMITTASGSANPVSETFLMPLEGTNVFFSGNGGTYSGCFVAGWKDPV
jgi:membrane-bound inhibitor of C-type lysozyme